MDEKELIIKLKGGDMAAFGDLYSIHKDACLKYASITVGATKAEDLIHDVFCRLWAGRDNLEPAESLRPYLLRSVYNGALNMLRHESNGRLFKNEYERRIEYSLLSEYDPDKNEIIRSLFSKDAMKTISDAAVFLPPKCREIFLMSYYRHMSRSEIAQALSLSLSTVDNQLYKALQFLRKQLSGENF